MNHVFLAAMHAGPGILQVLCWWAVNVGDEGVAYLLALFPVCIAVALLAIIIQLLPYASEALCRIMSLL